MHLLCCTHTHSFFFHTHTHTHTQGMAGALLRCFCLLGQHAPAVLQAARHQVQDRVLWLVNRERKDCERDSLLEERERKEERRREEKKGKGKRDRRGNVLSKFNLHVETTRVNQKQKRGGTSVFIEVGQKAE